MSTVDQEDNQAGASFQALTLPTPSLANSLLISIVFIVRGILVRSNEKWHSTNATIPAGSHTPDSGVPIAGKLATLNIWWALGFHEGANSLQTQE
ncbi:hypothetical protein DFH28DRAFT_1122606 [Melampsora americana]|nr:hypothetical protein DFH28DRAFT_1122606 [Melampsora americana]